MAPRVSELEAVAADQFGLVTAAQARARGVAAFELARWCDRGILYRVRHGVYGFVDSPVWCGFEDWAAQWLALRPKVDIATRRRDPGVVLSHDTAASLQNLGTIASYGLTLTSPTRINVRDTSTSTWRRPIGPLGVDWHLFEGIAVTTPRRTLTDLLTSYGDGGHVGTVIDTCLRDNLLTIDEVIAVCTPAATRVGSASRRRPRGHGVAASRDSTAGDRICGGVEVTEPVSESTVSTHRSLALAETARPLGRVAVRPTGAPNRGAQRAGSWGSFRRLYAPSCTCSVVSGLGGASPIDRSFGGDYIWHRP